MNANAVVTLTVGDVALASLVVVGLLVLVLAELRDVNRRLAHTRLMLFTLIQDLHFIHRITMSSFPELLEGDEPHEEGRHGRGKRP